MRRYHDCLLSIKDCLLETICGVLAQLAKPVEASHMSTAGANKFFLFSYSMVKYEPFAFFFSILFLISIIVGF